VTPIPSLCRAPRAALAGLAVLLALPAAAQGWSVEISASPTIPVVGLPASAVVRFLDTDPERVSIFIRPVGETAFSELATTRLESRVFEAQIVGDIPPQGIEAFAEYTVDGEIFTEPDKSPERFPFRIPSFNPSPQSAVTMPARQYRMVAVPLLFGPDVGESISGLGTGDPDDVFGDDFGPGADPAQWRLLRLPDASDAQGGGGGTYVDFATDPSSFGSIRAGAGYWLITAAGGGFDAEAGLSAGVIFKGSAPFATPVEIRLAPGWNQIGNPYFFPIDWNDVQQSGDIEDPVAFDGAYQPMQAVLQPWEGYFVFNGGNFSTLFVDALPDVGGGKKVAVAPADRLLERAGAGAFVLDVRAEQGGAADHVYLGVAGPAADAARLTLHKPPAIDDGLRLSIRADDDEALAAQLRAPLGAQAWDIELVAGEAPVDLWIDEHGDRPAGLVVSVDDLDRGVTLPVLGRRVDVPPVDGVAVRRLRVRLDGAGGAPDEIALGRPSPNPTAGSVDVPFALPEAGRARVSVFDVLGRLVRVVRDEPLDAGAHVARWDGRDASGLRVAAGLYVLRLDAASASASVRLTVLR
jgi:hypothetical protein